MHETTAPAERRSKIQPSPDALTWTMTGCERLTSISRREQYRLIARGDIAAIKSGKRTLIVADTVRAYLARQQQVKLRNRADDRASHQT